MLAPWEEWPYFDTPLETNYTLAQNSIKQIAKGNPHRVGILISVVSATAPAYVSTSPSAATGVGIFLQSTLPPLMLLQKDWGPLVQGPWYAITGAVGGTTVTVFEVVVHEWPRKGVGDGQREASAP